MKEKNTRQYHILPFKKRKKGEDAIPRFLVWRGGGQAKRPRWLGRHNKGGKKGGKRGGGDEADGVVPLQERKNILELENNTGGKKGGEGEKEWVVLTICFENKEIKDPGRVQEDRDGKLRKRERKRKQTKCVHHCVQMWRDGKKKGGAADSCDLVKK